MKNLFKLFLPLVAVISLTHLLFGLSIAYILDKRIVTASTFAIFPDLDISFDLLYPFTHRGITHTVLAVLIATFLVYIYSEDRVSAESCLLGYSSHLVLDLITFSGIPIFFPFSRSFSLGLASAYSIWWNLGFNSLSLAGMTLKENQEIFPSVLNLNKSTGLELITPGERE